MSLARTKTNSEPPGAIASRAFTVRLRTTWFNCVASPSMATPGSTSTYSECEAVSTVRISGSIFDSHCVASSGEAAGGAGGFRP
ncbi:MAG TPA: hypothetical protein VGF48_18720 [Thermoanaerobaculia bacterium]